MKTCSLRIALAATVVIAAILAVPALAVASPFVSEWSLLGPIMNPPAYTWPVISGHTIIYGEEVGNVNLRRFDLVAGTSSLFRSEASESMLSWDVSGDWVEWTYNNFSAIDVKNIKTGVTKPIARVPEEGLSGPSISTVDGSYVVWAQDAEAESHIKARNFGVNGSVFTVAGGPATKADPRIHGKRVAYMELWNGHWNIRVKTIGSSAAPILITSSSTTDQSRPDIGSHLVAWLVPNASGRDMIRYYDLDTGLTYDGPSSATYDMGWPRVSGDRIVYHVGNPGARDVRVWDTRIAKTSSIRASFDVAATTDDELNGDIDGNQITYVRDAVIYYARLVVPSISLDPVPSRIARGGHIHLTGSISDRGHRIGGASLGIEKYGSGRWTRVNTITASSAGAFSYQTPKTYSKTKYRVVYDGYTSFFGAPISQHLSTVSAVKSAWPR